MRSSKKLVDILRLCKYCGVVLTEAEMIDNVCSICVAKENPDVSHKMFYENQPKRFII